MTDTVRRIASLAAAFAPERAPSLVARLSQESAPDAVRHAEHLAASPREERLRSLSEALTFGTDPARLAEAAALERPAVAALLWAVGSDEGDPDPGASPLLVRLCRERLGR